MIQQEIFNDLSIILGHRINKVGEDIYFREIKIILPDEFPLLDIASERDKLIYYENNESVEFLLKKLDYSSDISVEDSKILIKLSELSDGLCLYLLNEFAKKNIRMIMSGVRLQRIIERSQNKDIDFFNLLRIVFSEYCALTIKMKNGTTLSANIVDVAKSHLFNCSMLMGANYFLVEKEDLEVSSKSNIERFIKRSKVEAPHKKYNDEMVQYYIEANITRVPKIQFLSFYNVLEYYADELNENKICQQIQSIITDPSFKQSKIKEYRKVSKIFNRKTIFHDDQALMNLLTTYIDKEKLIVFLEKNPFYSDNVAYKTKETKLRIEDSNLIQTVKRRIYSVRNALVHSKEGNDIKYIPIRDDSHIQEEIPLIKFLAEQIIINSATIIDY